MSSLLGVLWIPHLRIATMSFLVPFFSDKIITIHHNTTYKGFPSLGHHSANTHHFGAVRPRLVPPPPWFTLSLWHLNCPSSCTALFYCISPSISTVFPLFSWTTFVHGIVPGLTGFGVSSHLANQILLDNFSLTITGFLPDFQDFHRNLLQIRTDPCHSADSLWKYYFFCFRFRWTDKPPFRVINLRFLLQVLLTWNYWSRDHIKGQ